MRYVIVGNSTAAIGAVEGIRQIDKTGSITIISNESYHTYSRPLISYFLSGKTDLDRIKYRSDTFYKDNDCQLVLSRSVISINKENNSVTLDDNSVVYYDKLLLSTGSSPFMPPMKGVESVENKFTFMSLDDAINLKKAIDNKSRVLIIGAGLIGLKCAEGLHNKVESITVVDMASSILPSILDKDGAQIVKTHLENKNIQFKLDNVVEEFNKNTARLKSLDTIEFDILIIAVGVRPNISLIKDAGGAVERAIIIDEKMQTSIENIYSAGDCTQGYDISSESSKVLALLPIAYMQGECAGINMAGGESVFNKGIPMNSMGLLGLHMITAGSYQGDVYIDNSDGYKKLFYKDNKLVGYIMIGNVDKAGIYTSLIRDRIPLDSIDFELIKKRPALMAFSKEERDIKLGGVKV